MCLLLMSNSDFKLTIYLRFFVHYYFLQIRVITYYLVALEQNFKPLQFHEIIFNLLYQIRSLTMPH